MIFHFLRKRRNCVVEIREKCTCTWKSRALSCVATLSPVLWCCIHRAPHHFRGLKAFIYMVILLLVILSFFLLFCLQLLGELLLDRHNFTIMTKYISKPENLKLMMNLLRDKSRNIQFEAFHVFKVCYQTPL